MCVFYSFIKEFTKEYLTLFVGKYGRNFCIFRRSEKKEYMMLVYVLRY